MNKKIAIGISLAILVIAAGAWFFTQLPSNQPEEALEPETPLEETARAGATGPEVKEGFTLAFTGLDESESGEATGCSQESICLQGRFAPDLAVRLLLQNSTSCTARTGDAFHLRGEDLNFDATELTSLEGCAASDLGADSTIAIVETDELMDATFKWLPTTEIEYKKDPKYWSDSEATAALEAFEATVSPEAKGKTEIHGIQLGPIKLAQARSGGSEAGERPPFGPIFDVTGKKPRLLTPKDELCYQVAGGFELATTAYIQIEGAPCATDGLTTRVLRWSGKEWKQVLETPTLNF